MVEGARVRAVVLDRICTRSVSTHFQVFRHRHAATSSSYQQSWHKTDGNRIIAIFDVFDMCRTFAM
jgi:hypothetical protein